MSELDNGPRTYSSDELGITEEEEVAFNQNPIPQQGGEKEQRAIYYWTMMQLVFEAIAVNEQTPGAGIYQMPDAQNLAMLTKGMADDKEAMDLVRKEYGDVPNIAALTSMLYSSGLKEPAKTMGMAHGMTGEMGPVYNEAAWDAAVFTVASFGVAGGYAAATRGVAGVGASVTNTFVRAGARAAGARYGTQTAIQAKTIIAAFVTPLVARGMSTAQATQLAVRTLIMKLPLVNITSAATKASVAMEKSLQAGTGMSRYIPSSMWEKLVATNLAFAAVSTVVDVADNAFNPEANDEADQDALDIEAAERGEAAGPDPSGGGGNFGGFDLQNEIAQNLVNAGVPPMEVVAITGFNELGINAYGGAGTALQGPPANPRTYTKIEGDIPYRPSVLSINGGNGAARDDFGNPIAIDISQLETIEEVEAAIEAAGEAVSGEENPWLGVPDGYVAHPTAEQYAYDQDRPGRKAGDFEIFDPQGPGQPGLPRGNQNPVAVPAQYRVSHATDTFNNMTPAQLEAFQTQAILAGLINDNDPTFLLGSRDQQTMDALNTTMVHANNTGNSWQSQIEYLAVAWQEKLAELEEEEEEVIKPLFVPSSPYLQMDPETVNQQIEQDIERRLGRSANDWEYGEIARYMEANHRANYDTQIVGEKALWEARGRAQMGEDPGALPVLEEIDEGARYEAKFEERYETELDETDRWERQKKDTANLFRSFDNISAQMGGL